MITESKSKSTFYELFFILHLIHWPLQKFCIFLNLSLYKFSGS